MCRLISLAVFTFCLTTILVSVQLAARDDGRLQILRLSRGLTASRAEFCMSADILFDCSVIKLDLRRIN